MAVSTPTTANRDREEYLAAARGAARATFNSGDFKKAVLDFLSDLDKHPDWSNRAWTAAAFREFLYTRTPEMANKIIDMKQ